jgi:simple sugar transport system permease protein
MTETGLGWWGVPLGVFAGAIRSSTPFLFVSLGNCSRRRVAALTSARKVF